MAALALAAPAGAVKPVGGLTQLSSGCISFDGSSIDDGPNSCLNATGVAEPQSITLSSDGRFAYGTSYQETPFEAISIFSRNAETGRLTQLPGREGCITLTGDSTDGADRCTDGRATHTGDGNSIAISPDGRSLYLASQDFTPSESVNEGAIATFERDPQSGKLTQLGGLHGCVTRDGASEDGPSTCANGRALADPSGLAMSPDGRSLYASVYGDTGEGVLSFSRDAATSRISQLGGAAGCITFDGSSENGAGTCGNGRATDNPGNVRISPDGRNVYLGGYIQGRLALFSRNASTGRLTQLSGAAGCVSVDGASEDGAGTCVNGRAVAGPYTVELSPDGDHLYVSSYDSNAIAVFQRSSSNGTLTQLSGTSGCLSLTGASEDGAGTCTNMRALHGSYAPTVSRDGLSVYVPFNGTSPHGYAVLSRNPGTGALAQLPGRDGCVTEDGSSVDDGAGTCTNGRGLLDAYHAAVSPDGAHVYTASDGSGGTGTFGLFSRQVPPRCASGTVNVPNDKAVSVPIFCVDQNGDPFNRAIVDGPERGTLSDVDQSSGRVSYKRNSKFTDGDRFTFAAGDGHPSDLARITLVDESKPKCKFRKVERDASGITDDGLNFSVKCPEGGSAAASLSAGKKTFRRLSPSGSKSTRLGKAKKSLKKSGTLKVRLKLTKRARKRLDAASSGRLRKTKLTLRLRFVDRAGNARRIKKTVKLRP